MSLPDESVDDLDALIEERQYKGRSEVMRAALRDFLKIHRAEQKLSGTVNAILVLVYPEETERLLSDLRHSYNDVVTSMLHEWRREIGAVTGTTVGTPDEEHADFWVRARLETVAD